jgi:hypothetical protein
MYCVELSDDYVEPYIVLLNISILCVLFWRRPIRGGSQNMLYIKNINIFIN